jgi:hypothetical protein
VVSSVAGGQFTFSIFNLGPGDLLLTGTPLVDLVPGTNCGAGTLVQMQPAASTIPATAVADFVVFVDPLAAGAFDLTISIANTDANENPFNFTLMGNANAAAEVMLAAGSSFGGAPGGPFTLTVDPAFTLANATIEVSDPEGDTIQIVSVTPTVLNGVTAPSAAAAAAGPLALTWSGTVAATNTPQAYMWTVTIADTANQTQVVFDVTITVNDLAPTHTPANALSGNGTTGSPYYVEYTQGDTGAIDIDLATVSDANTAQTLNVGTITPGGGTPTGGTGFQFSISGGFLNVAPAGTLVAADYGDHTYTVEVTDGTNTITIEVAILVFGTTGAITFTTTSPLPTGIVDNTYNRSIVVAGGTAPYTFTLSSGTLPPGLTMSTAGVITGTPTLAGTSNFEVHVIDATNDTATQAFQIKVNVKSPGSGGDSGGGNGCNSGPSGATWVLLLLAAYTAIALRRRLFV